ncbi:hypothetical protein CVT26_001099 [Gymnopilus dilepis]|uniref:Uncharacterized protein n=1 Tax=Gymnopilus dilepis TaxID=231916 RepID=A0A409W7I0_9AGAR|nr:hypothetical protein CVT26_001099 [Gymnopilus dilepis]
MLILSSHLTTGQITFSFRLIIQLLSYVGVYILGRIVLAHAPRIAPLETHDLLNRFVGQSSITMSSLRWMWRRLTKDRKSRIKWPERGSSKTPVASAALTLALALASLYGFTVTATDIGLIGIHACTAPGPSYEDYPASVKSDKDALTLVQNNLLNGTNPSTVNAYLCDATVVHNVKDVFNNVNPTPSCTSWHNSTYGDGSSFRNLNTTDSEILMPRNLAPDTQMNTDAELNIYLISSVGGIMTAPTIQNGLAIVPHEFGVKMISGVPHLQPQTRVDIPKTLALEIEVGCLFLGITADADGAVYDTEGGNSDHLIPDALYLPEQTSPRNFSGPDNLQGPLVKAASQLRAALLPAFDPNPDPVNYPATGDYDTYGLNAPPFSWPFQVISWDPSINKTKISKDILANCTSDIQDSTNIVAGPQPGVAFPGSPSSCVVLLLSGSEIEGSVPWQRHDALICATTTQVNMVSATLSVDVNGSIALSSFDRHPSDISALQVTFANGPANRPANTTPIFDPLVRLSLSDNPSGQTQHFIYQELPLLPSLFSQGSGNVGSILVNLASNIWSLSDPSMAVINSSYFSANFSAGQVTKWAGGVAASYILGSVGYNGWAARGSKALTVISTGGHAATCYSPLYAFGFVPLLIAAVLAFSWAATLTVTSRLKKATQFEENYGGLAPHIELPFPGKLPPYTVLEWVDEPEPHLRPAVERITGEETDFEEIGLVQKNKTDEIDGGD